jgi:hypothetical protein
VGCRADVILSFCCRQKEGMAVRCFQFFVELVTTSEKELAGVQRLDLVIDIIAFFGNAPTKEK